MKSSALPVALVLCAVASVFAVSGDSSSAATPGAARVAKSASQILFDDFSYSAQSEMTRHGWIVRTAAGGAGVPGATWWREGVTFLADANAPRNRILRMTSSTDGTGEHTRQTQICHERKYLEEIGRA